MAGVVVFTKLADALRCGYHVFDRNSTGYLVRMMTDSGWALAIVDCRPR